MTPTSICPRAPSSSYNQQNKYAWNHHHQKISFWGKLCVDYEFGKYRRPIKQSGEGSLVSWIRNATPSPKEGKPAIKKSKQIFLQARKLLKIWIGHILYEIKLLKNVGHHAEKVECLRADHCLFIHPQSGLKIIALLNCVGWCWCWQTENGVNIQSEVRWREVGGFEGRRNSDLSVKRNSRLSNTIHHLNEHLHFNENQHTTKKSKQCQARLAIVKHLKFFAILNTNAKKSHSKDMIAN